MKILVTGSAGFIGFYVAKAFLERGDEVVGIDNLNDYYDAGLKYGRLSEAGIIRNTVEEGKYVQSVKYPRYRFVKGDITDRGLIDRLFETEKFDRVCHLAAQAGVRYSIDHPYAYIDSNITGFINILEACRHHNILHLVYASSSSVYGMNEKTPYSESDRTDAPVSLYAATKKANELMAHSYSKLFGLPATGLRFFTVYGPWGRPDMAPFLFMKSIMEGEKIRVFNGGDLYRDFTYIDDIVRGMVRITDHVPCGEVPYKIYNIGNSSPVSLMDFIAVIEHATGKKAVREMAGMQPGDVYCTYADTSRLEQDFGYKPSTPLSEGIAALYQWYSHYYSETV